MLVWRTLKAAREIPLLETFLANGSLPAKFERNRKNRLPIGSILSDMRTKTARTKHTQTGRKNNSIAMRALSVYKTHLQRSCFVVMYYFFQDQKYHMCTQNFGFRKFRNNSLIRH